MWNLLHVVPTPHPQEFTLNKLCVNCVDWPALFSGLKVTSQFGEYLTLSPPPLTYGKILIKP